MTNTRVLWVALMLATAGLMVPGCGSGGDGTVVIPTVMHVTPDLGPKEGGTLMTVSGSGFTPDMVVTIAEQPVVDFTFIDENTFTCMTPPVPGGTRAGLIVKNTEGVSFILDVFFFIPAPEVTSVTPSFGKPEGLVPVTISGKGFVEYNAGANVVTFGGAPATNVVTVSDESITCIIPPGAGPVTVEVTNNNGTGSLVRGYRYFPPPTAQSAIPDMGTPLGGTSIVITGTGYTANSPGAPTVLIGGRPALNVVAVSDTQITCDTPEGTPGPADITVSNANGTAVLSAGFTYFPTPTITACTPDNGSQAGMIDVTLTGTGFFDNGAGANTVTFDGVAATNVVTVNDTTITCTTPAGDAGPQTIEVTNNNGKGQLVAGYNANVHALIGAKGGTLYAIDEANASLTTIGAVGFNVDAMATHPNGTIYATTTDNKLITINSQTGAGTLVANLSNVPANGIGDLEFYGTRLLIGNTLAEVYEINITNGSISGLLSVFPAWAFNATAYRSGLGYDENSGQLIFAPSQDLEWFSINPDTGSYTTLFYGGAGHSVWMLAMWDGTMYGVDQARSSFGATRALYSWDSGLGTMTTIGSIDVDALTGTR